MPCFNDDDDDDDDDDEHYVSCVCDIIHTIFYSIAIALHYKFMAHIISCTYPALSIDVHVHILYIYICIHLCMYKQST